MMVIIVKRISSLAGEIRQTMIERTGVLLARKGLQGTSFTEVLEASGAPRGSLYHHFPGGKEELVMAAVAWVSARALDRVEQLRGRPATDVADAFIAMWRDILKASDFGVGCAVLAVTVGADTPNLLDSAAQVFRRWRVALSELLALGGVPTARAPALAAMLISACEGAVVLARAEQAMEPFDFVATEQRALVKAATTRKPRAG